MGDEFVIVGNDVLMGCGFPGFASDLLSVSGWLVMESGRAAKEVSVGQKGIKSA